MDHNARADYRIVIYHDIGVKDGVVADPAAVANRDAGIQGYSIADRCIAPDRHARKDRQFDSETAVLTDSQIGANPYGHPAAGVQERNRPGEGQLWSDGDQEICRGARRSLLHYY